MGCIYLRPRKKLQVMYNTCNLCPDDVIVLGYYFFIVGILFFFFTLTHPPFISGFAIFKMLVLDHIIEVMQLLPIDFVDQLSKFTF